MKNNKIHISIFHFSFFIFYLFLGLFLLECESQCWTVTNLCRTKVLDRARVNEACVASPLCTMTNEVLVTPPDEPGEDPVKKVNGGTEKVTLANRDEEFTYTVSQ